MAQFATNLLTKALYHPDVNSLSIRDRIDWARRAEKSSFDHDTRIKNSEGASFESATGHKVLANSLGFVGEYKRSYCSVSAVPIAQDAGGLMRRDYWYSVARRVSSLDSPEEVGKIAAERAVRGLGSRSVNKSRVPHNYRSAGGCLNFGRRI